MIGLIFLDPIQNTEYISNPIILSKIYIFRLALFASIFLTPILSIIGTVNLASKKIKKQKTDIFWFAYGLSIIMLVICILIFSNLGSIAFGMQ